MINEIPGPSPTPENEEYEDLSVEIPSYPEPTTEINQELVEALAEYLKTHSTQDYTHLPERNFTKTLGGLLDRIMPFRKNPELEQLVKSFVEENNLQNGVVADMSTKNLKEKQPLEQVDGAYILNAFDSLTTPQLFGVLQNAFARLKSGGNLLLFSKQVPMTAIRKEPRQHYHLGILTKLYDQEFFTTHPDYLQKLKEILVKNGTIPESKAAQVALSVELAAFIQKIQANTPNQLRGIKYEGTTVEEIKALCSLVGFELVKIQSEDVKTPESFSRQNSAIPSYPFSLVIRKPQV